MARYKDDRLINKVDDLAASLHATSEVLTTADHMLEHYRDLNKEQDAEIARLNGELHATRKQHPQRRSHGRSLPRTPVYSDVDERYGRSGRVRFTDDDSNSEIDEFESALNDLSRKQSRLEKELKRNRRKGSKELKSLTDTLKKESDDSSVERKLSKLQQQLEADKLIKLYKDETVEKLADEIRHIKGLVQSRDQRDQAGSRQDTISHSILEDFKHDAKERSMRDQEVISNLHRQLQRREDEQEVLHSQLQRTKGQLEDSNARQKLLSSRLEALEDKFEKERVEKASLEEEVRSFKNQAAKMNRENSEMSSQLQYIRDQPRPDARLNDIQRKVDSLERDREVNLDKLKSYKNESEQKDSLIDRMTSQIRELTEHVGRAEADKKRYRTELEDSMKRLRDCKISEEDMKSLLKEKEDALKESEDKRTELKNRAIEAIKDYRSRYRDLEREKSRLEERENLQQKELSEIKSERRELELGSKKSEKEIEGSEKKIKELENDLQRQQTELSKLMYEKARLEEDLLKSQNTRKEISKIQQEFQELSAKNAALSGQLAEETGKRRELDERLSEVHEQLVTAKDEASSLYQQLNEERVSHAKAMRKLEDELKAVSINEDRTLQEIMDKANQEKVRYEDELRTLKNQLIEERSNLKATQMSKNENENEIKRLNSELNRVIDENRRIRRKYQQMKKEYDEKLFKSENESKQNRERISELEDELRNNQENLLRTRESFVDSLKAIHSSMDSLLDGLLQETNQTQPIKSLSETAMVDPKRLSIEILEKSTKCHGMLRPIRDRYSEQTHQLSKAQERIKELLADVDKDKNYFLGELQKQNDAIESMKHEQRAWEKSKKEKNTRIKKLQNRVAEVTKHLEQCMKVLYSTLSAMEEGRNVLDDLDFLKDEHLEKERLHENYIRHTEKLGGIKEKLEDARIALQGVQEENMDATMFNLKFLQSLSPAPPKRRVGEKEAKTWKQFDYLRNDAGISNIDSILTSSDFEDERPPLKKSKDVLPKYRPERKFDSSFSPKRD